MKALGRVNTIVGTDYPDDFANMIKYIVSAASITTENQKDGSLKLEIKNAGNKTGQCKACTRTFYNGKLVTDKKQEAEINKKYPNKINTNDHEKTSK